MLQASRLILVVGFLMPLACCDWLEGSGTGRGAEAAPPPVRLTGRVTDAAGILSAGEEAALTTKLKRLEGKTGRQFVVATVRSLGGRDVADFTTDLANSWGVGRAEQNDGLVLLVAPTERKVRIAVGYGLERRLPNAICQQIIDEHMLPRFRQGDLPGGIEAGADALIARLRST